MESAHHLSSRPDYNSSAWGPFLNTAYLPLFQQYHLSLNSEVSTYNDTRIGLHRLCQILGIVNVNEFWFPRRLQELLSALFRFLKSFCFARIGLDPLSCQVLYHDSVSMIVSRFTSFTEKFLVCCDQVTEFFRSRHDCTSAFSERSPCYFGPLADVAIFVLRE